jgi:hypothetical protein
VTRSATILDRRIAFGDKVLDFQSTIGSHAEITVDLPDQAFVELATSLGFGKRPRIGHELHSFKIDRTTFRRSKCSDIWTDVWPICASCRTQVETALGDESTCGPQISTPYDAGLSSPDDLRAAGWSVAVHNDYRLNGENMTFWLFTHGSFAVKGEGRTDAEALDEVREQIRTNPLFRFST